MYPVILALLSAFFFGASTPIGKLLLEHLPPFQLAGWLYLGAAAGVAPGALIHRSGRVLRGDAGKKNIRRLIGAIGLGGVAGPVLLLMGLQRSSAASVALWLNLELVSTALLGFFIFRDYLGWRGWIGVAGVLAASMLLSWQGGKVGFSALSLVFCACICWGADNHLTALIDGLTPQQSTFWKGLVAGGVNLTLGLSLEERGAEMGSVAGAIAVGAVAYGFSIALYIKSARDLGATRSQMFFSSAPFFGVALSVALLGEKIDSAQIVAAVGLIASLILLFRDRHAHTHSHQAVLHRHAHNHSGRHHQNHAHADQNSEASHDHFHSHELSVHSHPHWPDIHHRHKHKQ